MMWRQQLIRTSKIIVADNFDRADNTTNLGSTKTGQPWIVQSGSWGILGNKVYKSAGGAGTDCAVVSSGIADCDIHVTFYNPDATWSAGSAGLTFRDSDNNNLYLLTLSPTGLTLTKKATGTSTTIGSYSFTPTTRTEYKIAVVLRGNTIKCYIDGIERISVNDSFNATATLHGLRSSSATVVLDDFTVEAG